MQKALNFFKDNKSPFFKIETGGKLVGTNSGDKSTDNMDEAFVILEKAIEYVPDGAKFTLNIYSSQKANNVPVSITTHKTENGEALPKVATSQMAAGFANSGWFEAFQMGMKMGAEQGLMAAKLESMERKIDEGINSGGKFDIKTIVENLSQTEQGQTVLLSVFRKLGIVDDM